MPLSGSLFENYLALADDGTAHLIEYEVSQGFFSSGPFTGLPPIKDAVVTKAPLRLVASSRAEPKLLVATFDRRDLTGFVKQFPVSGATTVGDIGFDEFGKNLFVAVDGTKIQMFNVESNGDLSNGITVVAGLPLIRDLFVESSGLYVVTDQRVFAYTLTGTGLPALISSVFVPQGVVSFKVSRGGFDESAYLLTGGNRVRTYDIDIFGAMIPVNTVELAFDLVGPATDVAPFSSNACLVATVDGEALALLRGADGLFHTAFSAFLGGAGNMRSIEVDYVQSRLLVTSGAGTVWGYLLMSDGDIGAVTADTTQAVGVAVRTKLLSIEFVQ